MGFELRRQGGFWSWRGSSGTVGVCFAGKSLEGPGASRETAFRRLCPPGVEPAWLQQIHSASVVDARPGDNGPGDALTTARADLGLAVVTADCVPVLLSAGTGIAAVHAGWRGLAERVVPLAAGRLGRRQASRTTAWIGPAIGPCCYEVGEDVAERVGKASSAAVIHAGANGRPHLDLVAAARFQLLQVGVEDVHVLEMCTRCDQRLWSYRRDGARRGRNVAVIWRAGRRG